MRNAQIEMIGLVLIVVLLLIGALFYLRFGVLNQAPASTSSLRTTQATRLLYALIPVELCDAKTVRDALVQCSEAPADSFCDAPNACTALTQELPSIINPVLHHALGLNYTLSARTADREFLRLPGCKIGTDAPAYEFYDGGKKYELALKICKT